MSTQPSISSSHQIQVSLLCCLLGVQTLVRLLHMSKMMPALYQLVTKCQFQGGQGERNTAGTLSYLGLLAGFPPGSFCNFITSGLGCSSLVSLPELLLRFLAAGFLSCACPHSAHGPQCPSFVWSFLCHFFLNSSLRLYSLHFFHTIFYNSKLPLFLHLNLILGLFFLKKFINRLLLICPIVYYWVQ